MRKSSSRRSREQLLLFECSSNLPSASIARYTHSLKHEQTLLEQSDNKDLRGEAFYCDRVQNSHNAQKKGNKSP